MKLITYFICFFTTIIIVKAQNPTFEQTVNYIIENTKGRVMYPGDLDSYSRIEGYNLDDVKISKNGKIEFITKHKNKAYNDSNDFTITFNIFDLVEKTDYPDGIRAHKFLVHFNGLNVSKGYGITYATDADAIKVARAFRHLKTLCEKDKDLFSQIPEEEKKTKLSREETINYINQTLIKIPKHLHVVWDGQINNKKLRYQFLYYITYNNNAFGYNEYEKYFFLKYNEEQYLVNEEKGRRFYQEKNIYANNIKLNQAKISIVENIADRKVVKSDEDIVFTFSKYLSITTKDNFLEQGRSSSEFRIYFPDGEEVSMKRIKNAFERLIELDSDEKDPFDD